MSHDKAQLLRESRRLREHGSGDSMKPPTILAISLLLLVPLAPAQAPQQEFTDPLALLATVSETYAANPETFHMESIAEK